MFIENLRYDILSQYSDQPEEVPQSGSAVNLKIRKNDREETPGETQNVTILAKYIAPMGPYSHVMGIGQINEEAIRCDAKYDTTNRFPLLTPIGEIFFQRLSNEISAPSHSSSQPRFDNPSD